MTKKLKVLDLFSGIAGFSLGLERTGAFETVAFCEIDKTCRKVLDKHYPNVPKFKDIKNMSVTHVYAGEGWLIEYTDKPHPDTQIFAYDIDVICGGFPCVDISIGGAQKGFLDEEGKPTRSGLWFEYRRLIDQIRPKWVIIENVANLLKLGFDQVLQDLSDLGFDVEWHVVRATDVGLPHQRERLFIIAHSRSLRLYERLGKERHVQVDQERESKTIHTEGSECQPKPITLCPILSRGLFDEYRASHPGRAATITGIRRVTDGISTGIHETARKQRIKQLGNAIVPDIAEIIGRRIVEIEGLL